MLIPYSAYWFRAIIAAPPLHYSMIDVRAHAYYAAEYEPHLLEVLHVESQRDEIVRGLLCGNARPAA